LSAQVIDEGYVGTTSGASLPPCALALTYDDGPDVYTLQLAEYLFNEGIHATFFINGCHIEGQEKNCVQGTAAQVPAATLDALVAYGHRVANHTQRHDDLTALDDSAIRAEVNGTQSLVDAHVADGYFFLRPPYGHWNSSVASAIRQDSSLDKLTGPIFWDVDALDWACFSTWYDPENIFGIADMCASQYFSEIYASPLTMALFCCTTGRRHIPVRTLRIGLLITW
jgi:peptidoglycan/xylan/chitin deacetylase (PgdA/CDA1 family)